MHNPTTLLLIMEEKDIEARVEKARALFQEGYNCAQAVFLTYSDMFGMDTALAAQLAASFGGGMGRMREVCGTVSGMAMIAGLMEPANDPKDKEAKARNAALVREFADAFRQKNGSIICRELLGLDKKEGDASVAPRKRPCVEFVATAARIVGEKLAVEK